jgi:acyl-CoA thioesterase-2
MAEIVAELINHLSLERLEHNLFRGPSRDIGTTRVYGGQVLGQALRAAQATVDEPLRVHSLHAYFLREGDHDAAIVYDVDRSRDGRSFSSRRVVAIQHGRQIFHMSASFQVPEEGLEYQVDAPGVPPPGQLADIATYRSSAIAQAPEKVQRILSVSAPFEVRPVEPMDWLAPVKATPRRHFWLRIADRLPDDPQLHCSILAYISDYALLPTTFLAHGIHIMDRNLQVASIDHAMWFQRPFRADEWLLYAVEGISTSGARGLARGRFYREDGVLVASTVQEGLVRLRNA